MKRTLISIALCAASTWASAQSEPDQRPAWLPSTIGLHLASQHADKGKVAGDPRSLGWNNANTGLLIGWRLGQSQIAGAGVQHQLVVGGFRNSLFKQSHYIAIDSSLPLAQTRLGSFAASLSLGAISGYDRMTGVYAGGPIPAGQRVEYRCDAAAGCRNVLLKNIIAPLFAPAIDYRPALPAAPTLRLTYLHDSGNTGSKAVHLSARWNF